MALSKDDLNTALKKEKKRAGEPKKTFKYITTTGVDEDGFTYTLTQRVEVKPGQEISDVANQAQKASDEIFAKSATKVGKKDGEILGGIQSIGKETITPNEVIENTSVAKITDKVKGLTGTKLPSASLGSLTGLPAQVAGDKAKSGIAAFGSGAPAGVASLVAAGKDKSGKLASEVGSFSASIADAGELSNISSSLPNVNFGNLESTVKDISPVSQISGKISDVKDNVVNNTGIGGMAAKATQAKGKLGFFKSAKSVVGSVLNNVTSAVDTFGSFATKAIADQTKKFDRGIKSGFLQNIGETLSGSAKSSVANIVAGGVSLNDREYREVFGQLTQKDEVEKTKAVKKLTEKSTNVSSRMKRIVNETSATSSIELQRKVTATATAQGIPQSEITSCTNEISTIDEAASKLDTTIGGTFVVDAKLFDDGVPITQNNQRWSGRSSSSDIFTYISSVEELELEMSTIVRDVTEVIVHATETATDKNIGAIEINNIHNELGHDGIAYHYVIRRDGRLQRGRPVNKRGEHAPTNNHDTYSIGIVMVGGLDSPSGSDNSRFSAHAFTRAQFTTLEQFLTAFYRKFPGGQVFGHNDIDANELDPYFDVVDYIEAVFRKKNKTTSPQTRGPLTPVEIIKGISYVPQVELNEEKEEVVQELAVTPPVKIEEIDEEKESNIFVRPPKPEGYPQTRSDGVVIDYEWDDESLKWVQSEDWTDYKEEEDTVDVTPEQISALKRKREEMQLDIDNKKGTLSYRNTLKKRIAAIDAEIDNLESNPAPNPKLTTIWADPLDDN